MSNIQERIIQYINFGDIYAIRSLLNLGALTINDTFDIRGCAHHSNFEAVNMIEIVALNNSVKYAKIIDLLLDYGCDINKGNDNTPLETAILYKNFDVAAYIEKRGGTFDMIKIKSYDAISDTDLLLGLNTAREKLAATSEENVEVSFADVTNIHAC
jgi:ankyrin repeat protein